MTIDNCIADLARATMIAQFDADDAQSILAELCDHLIECAEQIDDINANTIMHLAHMIDPTESNFAAEIRDTMRDNTDLTII